MKILVTDPVGQSGMEYLTKCGYEVVNDIKMSPDGLRVSISEYDALIVRSRTQVTKEILTNAKKLKVVARSGAGVDTIDMYAAAEQGIAVVNAPGANSEAVAEHTMALMLGLARDLVTTSQSVSHGEWNKSSYRGMELSGKTLGILGYGHIGSRVAQLANAFGMQILIYTKTHNSQRSAEIAKFKGKEVSFDELLSQSDIVSLHVPLSVETRGIFDASAFSKMKPISYLINTSRGAVIDEQALIDALKNGTIAGAALDVFAVEPLEKNNPLCSMKNVILTPHVAANSRESEERASILIAEDIDRIFRGEDPIRRVTV